MQRSRHYNAWYCAWKACEKLEGLLALSQAIWPAGQEWESGLQEETQEAQRVRKSREEVEQVLYTVTKSVDFSNADVFVQAIVTPNLLVWKGPNGIYDVWIKRIKLLSIINTQRKFLLVGAERKSLVGRPDTAAIRKKRAHVRGGANQMEGHEGMGKDVQLTQSAW